MPQKSQLPPKDRAARSRLVQLLSKAHPLARASLVVMARTCGKKGCKCADGEKHVSLYLATRLGNKRKMLYIPPDLEEAARRLVENGRKVEELVEEMSQASLEHLVAQKAKRAAERKRRP
jgi:hypothetical protein